MKHILNTFVLFLYAVTFSQNSLKGIVLEKKQSGKTIGVQGASVYWLHTQTGTTTQENGSFTLPYKKEFKKLIINYIGYKTDTLTILNNKFVKHVLKEAHVLDEVTIKTQRQSVQRSFLQTQNVMTIDSGELLKAACCNLSESFETNPSIDVNFSDALTGTKQIQMLGLKSPYLLINQENIPSIRGASQVYGLTFTPGTWVESIQITKGAGSVINGYESISGQINTELVKPFTDSPFFINVYRALGGRTELNIHLNQKVSKKWHTGLYLHGNYRGERFDRNKDSFLDAPLANQMNIMNRWQYIDAEKGWVSFLNLRFLKDRKQTGQVNFVPNHDKGTTNAWGSEINTTRFDASAKIGYVFPELPFQSFGFQTAYSNHNQESYFGLKDYSIKHQSFYGNALFSSIIGDTRHKFKTGISVVYDKYHEQVLTNYFNRTEKGVGAFFEYAFDNSDDFSITAGIRLDYHNVLGTFITPRLHTRYVVWNKGVLRASIGKGKRSANVFAENQQLFSSSRTINLMPNQGKIYGLNPETAWNYGISFLQGYKLFGKKGDITLDFYQTNFENQVVVDWENAREVSFYNLSGKSIANSFQLEVNQNIIPYFNIRMAYRINEVTTDYLSGSFQKPLLAKNRFFTSISYETLPKNKEAKWKFDVTYNWLGKQRLPNTTHNPSAYQLATYSRPYSLLTTQITKVFSKRFEVYAGAENITNYKQENPIVGSDNPFGNYFDTTMIYAPIFGSNFYTGLRFKIN
ncbi:TonB-dependent receptor [Tenacibaculum sp. TC6]|uniref:TonB-dependent receptor n=1 Tax=Tenacibaculum sp. TC6 TaxID=3423223 RepID=UPI003D36F414